MSELRRSAIRSAKQEIAKSKARIRQLESRLRCLKKILGAASHGQEGASRSPNSRIGNTQFKTVLVPRRCLKFRYV